MKQWYTLYVYIVFNLLYSLPANNTPILSINAVHNSFNKFVFLLLTRSETFESTIFAVQPSFQSCATLWQSGLFSTVSSRLTNNSCLYRNYLEFLRQHWCRVSLFTLHVLWQWCHIVGLAIKTNSFKTLIIVKSTQTCKNQHIRVCLNLITWLKAFITARYTETKWLQLDIFRAHAINSLRPSDAYMRR